jgi:antitoxin ParD1/3/4
MTHIERMTIAMPIEMAMDVRLAVESGDYSSNSEVFRDALREWKLKRHLQQQQMQQTMLSIQHGLADSDAGHTKPAAEVLDRLEKKYRDKA